MLDLRRVVSIAFIGKHNDLMFFYTEEDANESLHLQMLTHSALDVIEERKRSRLISGTPMAPYDTYLGHLFSIDSYKLFGLSGNTNTKIVVICEAATPDTVMKDFFSAISTLYFNALKNPFQPIGQTITSKTFQRNIQNMMQKQNQILQS